MSRFTDPNKWHKDKWFRKLNPLQKLIFLYLIDNCDIAGFWEKDFDMMAYSIGVSEEKIEGAYKGLGKSIVEADGWLWIRHFIKHQKNLPLNPKNNAHKGIIRLLKTQENRFSESDLFTDFLKDQGIKSAEKEGANKGLISPTGKGRGRGKGNIDKEVSENSMPEMPERIHGSDTVKDLSLIWFTYRKEKNRWPGLSEQEMIRHQMKQWGLSKSKRIVAIAIQNGWLSLKEDYLDSTGSGNRLRELKKQGYK